MYFFYKNKAEADRVFKSSFNKVHIRTKRNLRISLVWFGKTGFVLCVPGGEQGRGGQAARESSGPGLLQFEVSLCFYFILT